mgnify:CR=1 FL=1
MANWNFSTRGNIKTHVKQNVSENEYILHREVFNLSKKYNCLNVPKILEYKNKIMTTVRIESLNVADLYGEDDVPVDVFNNIREIIQTLYDSGIIYPDITGYNFIETQCRGKSKIWVFDFEHAEYMPNQPNNFVEKFLSGENFWNPYFK